jgi:hypothetical protein
MSDFSNCLSWALPLSYLQNPVQTEASTAFSSSTRVATAARPYSFKLGKEGYANSDWQVFEWVQASRAEEFDR